jgi:hypothetical protein
MMRSLIIAALLMLSSSASAEDDDGVKTAAEALVPADQRLQRDVVFDKAIEVITLIADKRLVREPKLPPEESTYRNDYEESGVYMEYPMDVRLRATDPQYFVLRCNSGGSNDPACVYSISQDPEAAGTSIPGKLFVMPGDGCVYVAGHTDNMFDSRARYCLKGTELQLVAQPFSYAGFRSKALRQLTLYSDKAQTSVVTTIAPGAFVEVVLQDGDLFLLRDAFGLTGWAKLDTGSQQPTEIEGFFYNGD